MTTTTSKSLHSPGASESLVLLGVILLSMNLRSPLTAISPVIDAMQAGLGIAPSVAALLTSIPVLCFGVLTPFASLLIARIGVDAALRVTLVGVALGALLRPAGGLEVALFGTVVIGATLTVGNIMILMLIARDFPARRNSVTGIYASAVNVGTMCTSALTAPLASLCGWRVALGAWAVLAVAAYVLWQRVFALRRAAGETPAPVRPAAAAADGKPAAARPSPWRRGVVWWLVLAFAVHLFVYYGVTAWLPSYLIQRNGMSPTQAGIAASALQICGLIGAFGVPLLISRRGIPAAVLLRSMGITWVLTLAGYLFFPQAWWLWCFFGGFTHGGGFVAIFALVMAYAADLDENRRISSIVQGLGYCIAASGPIIIGALHDGAGGWPAAFALLAGIALLISAVGWCLPRDVARQG